MLPPGAAPTADDMGKVLHNTLLSTATVVACLACLVACGWLDEAFYVDEAALLAGFSAPTFRAANVSQLPPWPSSDAEAQQRWLVDRLDEHDLLPEQHTLQLSRSCRCTAVSAVVQAARVDGREAVLLSTRFGGSGSTAGEARGAALLVELGAQLAAAPWLSKDVLLLFVPCCPCGDGTEASADSGADCAAAPLRRLLDGLTLQPALGTRGMPPPAGGEAAVATMAARTGLIRQALSLSLGAGRPAALRAALAGHGGQLPNLDLYTAVRKVAQRGDVGVPLLLHAPGAGAADHRAARPTAREDVRAATARAARLLGFGLGVAWGVAEGDHAAAMHAGIDALELRGVELEELDDDEGAASQQQRRGRAAAAAAAGSQAAGRLLSDDQLMALLELTVRCWSCLHEALHHSHCRGSLVPSLVADAAPLARLVTPRAQAAPTHPRAPPEHLGGLPWPQYSPPQVAPK